MRRCFGWPLLLFAAVAASGCAALKPDPAPPAEPASTESQPKPASLAPAASAASVAAAPLRLHRPHRPRAETWPQRRPHPRAAAHWQRRPWQWRSCPPAPVKALLERYLDLVRLGTLAKGAAVGEFELARLIDCHPRRHAPCWKTRAISTPEVTIERPPGASANGAERVKVAVNPGTRSRVTRATIEVEGDLARAVEAGDASRAIATLAALRSDWPLRQGARFAMPIGQAQSLQRSFNCAPQATPARGGAAPRPTSKPPTTVQACSFASWPTRARSTAAARSYRRPRAATARTVTNLATFGPGTPVTETLPLDFQDRLVKAGLFQVATVTLDTDPAQAGAARINVRVTELQRHQLTAGVGISANNGPA